MPWDGPVITSAGLFFTYQKSAMPNVYQFWLSGWQSTVPQLATGPSWVNMYKSSHDFSVSWNVPVPLTLCMTAGDIPGNITSVQYSWTNGFTLHPSKNYSISLSMVTYTRGSVSWISFEPGRPILATLRHLIDIPTNRWDAASFSVNVNQRLFTHRDLGTPSIFVGVAHVLSGIGGTFAFIDGLFALISVARSWLSRLSACLVSSPATASKS